MLLYDTRCVTNGAAQGLILGPDLWNVSYDTILHMELLVGTFLIGYADDIIAVVLARNMDSAQAAESSYEVDNCRNCAPDRILTVVPVQVGSQTIETKQAIKDLGVMTETASSPSMSTLQE